VSWRVWPIGAAIVLAPGAVLLRGAHPSSGAARLFAALALVAAGVAYGIPFDFAGEKKIPLLHLGKLGGETISGYESLLIYGAYALFGVAVIGLVAFLPSSATPKTGFIAWVAVAVAAFGAFAVAGRPYLEPEYTAEAMKASLGLGVYPAIEILAGGALAGWGLCALCSPAQSS
jgi:hypothetical protein